MRPKNVYFTAPDELNSLTVSPQIGRFQPLTPSHVQWLAEQFSTKGQQTPVIIRNINGQNELVAGRHRKAAVEMVNSDLDHYGLKKPIALWGTILVLSDAEAIEASLSENSGLPITVIDLSKSANDLSNLDYNGKQIAELLTTSTRKITPNRVSQLRKLHVQPEEFKLLIHRGQLKESHARFLMLSVEAGSMSNEEMVTIAKGVASGDLKMSNLTAGADESRRASLKEKGKALPRSISEVRTFLAAVAQKYDKAAMMLAYVDGSPDVDESEIIELFKD